LHDTGKVEGDGYEIEINAHRPKSLTYTPCPKISDTPCFKRAKFSF